MAHPGESDEAYARRLAMEDGSHAVPMGGVPMRHGGFPSHAAYPQVVHGVPVATVVSDAPSGGGSGSGSSGDEATGTRVAAQTMYCGHTLPCSITHWARARGNAGASG
mmetsp:Transcript_2412/g.8193  ORF Transcript_2412/g.8193 Transcript_2412/m.8193 type:complete len:108 (-) Transcript_2412:16-339(-)